MNYTVHTVNGQEFRAIERGDPRNPPVLLLHGFPQDATCWNQVASLISEAGYRTIAPDLRGYSPATRTTELSDYSVDNLVEDVVQLIDRIGRAPHVVGHDWGGSLLWNLRRNHPDRIASATLISSPHPAALNWAMSHGTEQLRKSWYIGAFLLPSAPEFFLTHFLSKYLTSSGLPSGRADYYQNRAREAGAAAAMIAWYRQMLRDRGRSARPLTAGSSATVPTSYLWGRNDPFLGRTAAYRTADTIPDLTFLEVDGGHWLPETAPETVADFALRSFERHRSH